MLDEPRGEIGCGGVEEFSVLGDELTKGVDSEAASDLAVVEVFSLFDQSQGEDGVTLGSSVGCEAAEDS